MLFYTAIFANLHIIMLFTFPVLLKKVNERAKSSQLEFRVVSFEFCVAWWINQTKKTKKKNKSTKNFCYFG